MQVNEEKTCVDSNYIVALVIIFLECSKMQTQSRYRNVWKSDYKNPSMGPMFSDVHSMKYFSTFRYVLYHFIIMLLPFSYSRDEITKNQ